MIHVLWSAFLPDPCAREESFDIVVATFCLWVAAVACAALRPVHFLLRHAFFFVPGPPKHFMSRQSAHVPQFGCWHPAHSPQRPLERFRLTLTVMEQIEMCKLLEKIFCKGKYVCALDWVYQSVIIHVSSWSSCGFPVWEGLLTGGDFSSCCKM